MIYMVAFLKYYVIDLAVICVMAAGVCIGISSYRTGHDVYTAVGSALLLVVPVYFGAKCIHKATANVKISVTGTI